MVSTKYIQPVPLILEDDIARKVKELAADISSDYRGMSPLAVGVLKGAFVFLADLIRHITVPVSVDFISLSSYGSATTSSGQISVRAPVTTPLQDRHVLIAEDIVDTGLSIDFLVREFGEQGARSVKVCTLLDKPSRRIVPVELHYVGFTVPDKFVVGYGIDCDEQFRGLPYVGFLDPFQTDEAPR